MGISLIDEGFPGEEVLLDLLGDGLSPGLELRDIVLQVLDADLFDLARHHLAGLVGLLDAGELVVVLHEERQVLEGHVDCGVASQFALFLGRVLSAGEGESVHFVLDLVGRVGEEDGRGVDARGHLGAWALQGG